MIYSTTCKTLLNFADYIPMKKSFMIFLPMLLFGLSPFESPEPNSFNLSVFETKATVENIEATKNEKIKCRTVCDKKIYKEQKIADAVKFYEKSSEYSFKISK